MKYIYSKEKIDAAMKRLRRFRSFKAYLSEHFAGGKNTVIEICGIDNNKKKGLEKIEKINRILSDILGENACLEYHDVCCNCCYIGEDDEAQRGSRYEPIVLNGRNLSDYPDIAIYQVQKLWQRLTEMKGDHGTYVLVEKLTFVFHGKHYILKPLDNLQRSLSREETVELIVPLLKSVGCTNLYFDTGRMD